MYAADFSTWVTENTLAHNLCGARRPGHFRGVCTIVAKLFNITQPHLAVFGWKDAQQGLIIRRMARDLNLAVRIVMHPIVRERDGLAISSRNAYLSAEERTRAAGIACALRQARAWHAAGAGPRAIIARLRAAIAREVSPRIDYISVVDLATLRSVAAPRPGQSVMIAVAVFVGRARLIDNIRLRW
jgi:pantoate--beta-alanine ligase